MGRLRNDPRNLAETLERIEADIVRVQRELEQNRHSLKVLGDDGREVHRLWSLETIGKLNTKVSARGGSGGPFSLNARAFQPLLS